MSKTITNLVKKRYDDLRRMAIIDCIDTVLNTIAVKTVIDNKDKSYTLKKLNDCLKKALNSLKELNDDRIPNHIINTLKPKVSTNLNKAFCFKQSAKGGNIDTNSSNTVVFSPYIQNAIEISQKEIKSENIKLIKPNEYYHFFALPLTIEGKNHIIVYAEENKFSKREIVEVLVDNIIVDSSVVSTELKDKYYLI